MTFKAVLRARDGSWWFGCDVQADTFAEAKLLAGRLATSLGRGRIHSLRSVITPRSKTLGQFCPDSSGRVQPVLKQNTNHAPQAGAFRN